MDDENWFKVGELATRAGLTVRTLHHWHDIGILAPERRTSGGHREYGPRSVRRLQHIVSLRSLGFELSEIRALLEDPDWDLATAIRRQLEAVEARIEQQRQLCQRLRRVQTAVEQQDERDTLLLVETIRNIMDVEKYYTQEQLEELADRAEQLGPEGMQQAQDDWASLFDAFQQHIDAGTAPDDPALDELLAEQQRLIEAFTGGNPGIAANLRRVYENEDPESASHGMMSGELATFIGRARAAREHSADDE